MCAFYQDDWNAILKQEEDYIEKICGEIIALRPDIVITEKGVSGAFVLSCRVARPFLFHVRKGCCTGLVSHDATHTTQAMY